ncbi:hypothetical protein CRG98_014611 [Punica granatum]|uniref:Uncharacterized protein n=1 Tax=Punica granatum TaxID=22663 RepID=A0A2I0K8X0_PUNGR|nr:hypothetical protein CRG98_014611 [Punica granatum]
MLGCKGCTFGCAQMSGVRAGTLEHARTRGARSWLARGRGRAQERAATGALLTREHVCAPEFNLVGARMREAYATRLRSIHLPGDARRTHVRRSRHSLFTTRRSRAVESPGSRGTRYT